MTRMKRYAIVSKQDESSYELAELIRKELDPVMTYDENMPEMVISIGGDGTILYSVKKYEDLLDDVCFVGIHTGTLGFFTDYQNEEYMDLVNDIKTKDVAFTDRALIEVHMGDSVRYALNEMRIENNRRSQVIDVFINEEHMETFRGNGLCVCTPSGSTAYNKSVNGAVIRPGNKVMELSEIAGIHHNAYRSLGSSLILGENDTIRFETLNYEDSVICIDLKNYEMTANKVVRVNLSKKVAHFLDYRQVSFISRLKKAFL